MDPSTIFLAGWGMIIVVATIYAIVSSNSVRGGTQPLNGPGLKPGLKPNQSLSNIRAARPLVRPTARRMRTGGTAYMLRRNEYATDLLFLIALDAALAYDEMHYGLYDFVDSPFINDDFDYAGSDFEDYAEQDSPDRFDPPPPPVEEPEATSFEDLSSDDEDTRSSWGEGGTEDFGGSDYDSGGSWDD